MTSKFAVLVVDDEPGIRQSARLQLEKLGGVRFLEAATQAQAVDVIKSSFLHLAFVDLNLDRKNKGIDGGRKVLDALAEVAPSCKVIIISKVIAPNLDTFLVLLGPDRIRRIAGVIGKTGDEIPFAEVAESHCDDFAKRRVTSPAIAQVVADLRSRGNRAKNSRTIESEQMEVEALLSDMFGSLSVPRMKRPGAGVSVEMRTIPRGLSASLAFEVEPVLGTMPAGEPVMGNLCVVKIGPASSIRAEVDAYYEVVQFGVALSHRTELLAHAVRDALGAVCYSFAGGGSKGVIGLDEILRSQNSRRSTTVIDRLFDPVTKSKRWYGIEGHEVSLHYYFNHRDRSRGDGSSRGIVRGAFKTLDAWISGVRYSGLSVTHQPEEGRWHLNFGSFELVLPDADFSGDSGFQAQLPSCLVHGDMHGGNVLVDRYNRPWLIDYASAGIGPRAMDVASLLASLRLTQADLFDETRSAKVLEPSEVQELAKTCYEERRLWKALGSGDASRMVRPGGGTQPFWSITSAHLVSAWMKNFQEVHPLESLYACLMQAVWLVGFGQTETRNLRLAAWIDGLLGAIEATRGREPNWPT